MDTKPNKAQEAVQEDLNLIEKAKANRNKITIGVVILAVALIVGFGWWIISSNGNKKADNAIALADIEQNDSLALAYYQDAAKLGYKSGNRAGLEAAIALYQKGEYEQALGYLKDASVKSSLVEAGRYSLMGDCYVNLEKLDDALKAYKNAVKAAENNPQVVPFVLVKEANVYRALGKYNDEYECYQEIYKNYPAYAQSLRFDIRKYAERAKANAANK